MTNCIKELIKEIKSDEWNNSVEVCFDVSIHDLPQEVFERLFAILLNEIKVSANEDGISLYTNYAYETIKPPGKTHSYEAAFSLTNAFIDSKDPDIRESTIKMIGHLKNQIEILEKSLQN